MEGVIRMAVMTVDEFIDKLHLALSKKTLYVMGGFGAPLTPSNKTRYINKNTYNKKRKSIIMAASTDTFAFDCVNLGKGILWGWNGNTSKNNGGAVYKSNGVVDTNADGMFKNYCYDKSSDFSKIERGEVLWMSGHFGYYIGNGLAVEATPKWKNKVQITAVGNIGKVDGYNTRTWKKHAKWKYLSYTVKAVPVYRLYNPNTGFHTFTTDSKESTTLASRGWKYEGKAWNAASQGTPVYRLYNPNNGDHVLTATTLEKDTLVKRGYKNEGIRFYSAKSKKVAVYRLYNVNSGEHFYTADSKERSALIARGWKDEGTAFYGV